MSNSASQASNTSARSWVDSSRLPPAGTACYRAIMRVLEFENIVRVLNAADVRYLVVGGIAVVAHGRRLVPGG